MAMTWRQRLLARFWWRDFVDVFLLAVEVCRHYTLNARITSTYLVGIPNLTDTFKGIKGEKMESQKLQSKKDSHILHSVQGSETRVPIMVVLFKTSLLKTELPSIVQQSRHALIKIIARKMKRQLKYTYPTTCRTK